MGQRGNVTVLGKHSRSKNQSFDTRARDTFKFNLQQDRDNDLVLHRRMQSDDYNLTEEPLGALHGAADLRTLDMKPALVVLNELEREHRMDNDDDFNL